MRSGGRYVLDERHKTTWSEVAWMTLTGMGVLVVVQSLIPDEEGGANSPFYPGIVIGCAVTVAGILLYGKATRGSYSPVQWYRSMGLKRWKDIGELPTGLLFELSRWRRIAPWEKAAGEDSEVYLASCTLKDGRVFPRTTFVKVDTPEQERIFPKGLFRVWYRFDPAKMVDVSQVRSVSMSPFVPSESVVKRLSERGHYDDPVRHARLTLRDGMEAWVWAGYSNFVDLPHGYTAADIERVDFPPDDYDWHLIEDKIAPHSPAMLCIFRRQAN